MKSKQQMMRQVIEERLTFEKKERLIRTQRQNPNYETFCVGDIVLIHAPTVSSLQAPSRKLKHEWVGPLKVVSIKDPTHYLLADLNGKALTMPIHIRKMKKYNLNMGTITNGQLDIISNFDDLLSYVKKISKEGDK